MLHEWDARTGAPLGRFPGGPGVCAYTPDGSRILSATAEGMIREWDARDGARLLRFQGQASEITVCAYSRDGTLAVSGSATGTLRQWNASNGDELLRFEGHASQVVSSSYNLDDSRILSSAQDGALCEWDARTGAELHRVERSVYVYKPDRCEVGRPWIYARELQDFDAHTGELLRRVRPRAGFVTRNVYRFDGERVVTASVDGEVVEWDARTGQMLRRFAAAAGSHALAYRPDGARVLSAQTDGRVYEWEARTGRRLRSFETTEVSVCVYSSDGTRMLLAAIDTLQEWDAVAGRELQSFAGHTGGITAVAYSPDDTCVLSASTDGTLKLWSRAQGECLHTVCGMNTFTAVAWHGSQILAGDASGNLWFLEVDEAELRHRT